MDTIQTLRIIELILAGVIAFMALRLVVKIWPKRKSTPIELRSTADAFIGLILTIGALASFGVFSFFLRFFVSPLVIQLFNNIYIFALEMGLILIIYWLDKIASDK